MHGPTPLLHLPALDDIIGANVWIKRDDATSGAESGNKIRKLEFLLADAKARGARVVVTCGGLQSNHARATALTCAQLGLRSEIRFVSHDEYRERGAMLEQARADSDGRGQPAYVVPEGGSNGLGSLGYVEAMRETKRQMQLGLAGDDRPFDVVAHACGSGGTAAGVALGAAAFGVARETWAFAVCDDRQYFTKTIARILLL